MQSVSIPWNRCFNPNLFCTISLSLLQLSVLPSLYFSTAECTLKCPPLSSQAKQGANILHFAQCNAYCALHIAILLTSYCNIAHRILQHCAYPHCILHALKISTAFFVSVVTKHIWGVMANLLFDGYEVSLWRNRGN